AALEKAKFLINNGADVNVGGERYFTPLIWAVREKWPKVVELLIASGANINAKDSIGNNALHYVEYEEDENSYAIIGMLKNPAPIIKRREQILRANVSELVSVNEINKMATREKAVRLFKQYAKRIRNSMAMREDISTKRILAAIKSYAYDADIDKVLGMIDATIFNTGKSGDLFTEDAYYFHFIDCNGAIHYDRVSHVEKVGKKNIRVYFKNGDDKEFSPLGLDNYNALVEYLNKMIELVNRSSSTDDESGIKNGDVIKVSRKIKVDDQEVRYFHYGIYVEGGTVIHYTGATGPADFKGVVRETPIEDFLNGAKELTVCIFPKQIDNVDELNNPEEINISFPSSQQGFVRLPEQDAENFFGLQMKKKMKESRARNYHLYSGDETVARARGELGKKGYNLVTNNCEHFAIWCKTGLQESSQVNQVLDIIELLPSPIMY
ncbi:MAG: lecithin retinol acyltransferase family protein, partial [Synergistaceae bacterium]|nr:lecithin retinol acyltransferase family protein [Synergistaceae bacterium]